jgi:hypothetical protein
MGTGSDGKTFWTGTPTRDVEQFLSNVFRYLGWRSVPDVYMCLSRQRDHKTNAKGEIRAAKSQASALALKSIWLDLDIKPKAFTTLPEALKATADFVAKYGLPPPSALVMSGGGLHVYWISDRALTPQEWFPYAEGLKTAAIEFWGSKVDTGVIADSARVLRVPGTFNMKNGGKRPVKLLRVSDDADYDFATTLSSLASRAPALPRPVVHALAGAPAAAFANTPVESLSEGIGHDPLPPLDWKPLVKTCGWFTEAVTTGGASFGQGLWNLTTLAATFLENGHVLAHRMARGHADYQYDETEALWERKLAERASKSLGWPSCRSIQAEGCSHCASCPLLAVGKSPLNLAGISKPTPAATGLPAPAGVASNLAGSAVGAVSVQLARTLVPLTDADLPPGFTISNGLVCKVVEKIGAKGEGSETLILPMFHLPLYGPMWAQSVPDSIRFVTAVDQGTYHEVLIPRIKMTTIELEHTLLEARLAPVSDQLKYAKGLMTSWIAKLNQAASAHQNVPFGWHMNESVCEGFSYGSVLFKADGSKGPSSITDVQMKKIYGPQGEIEKWMDAYTLIMNEKRIGLQVIMAASFAAPLAFAAGEYSVLMAVNGDSGAHKSSAARVGTAVWGKPVLAKEAENATYKSAVHKLGMLRHLPYFWDEIKDEKAQNNAYNVLYMASAGSEGDRLHANITHQEKGTWLTICGIFSNPVFTNYVLKKNPNTTAGLARVFEWTERLPLHASGSTSDASRTFMLLDDHYGMMGLKYAAFLGPNRDLVYNAVVKNSHYFEDAVRLPNFNHDPERYWIAFAAAVQTGAEMANEHLGLWFDLDGIRAFLVEKIKEQRNRTTEESVQGGSKEHTERFLTAFLKAMTENTVRTSNLPAKRIGRPAPVEALPPFFTGKPCHVHWVHTPAELRLSRDALIKWLNRDDISGDPKGFVDALKVHFNARVSKGFLAMGTTFAGGREPIIIIPVLPNSSLHAQMTGADYDCDEEVLGGEVEVGEQAGRQNGAPVLHIPGNGLGHDTDGLFANPDCALPNSK